MEAKKQKSTAKLPRRQKSMVDPRSIEEGSQKQSEVDRILRSSFNS
jgi:hypothetical protein